MSKIRLLGLLVIFLSLLVILIGCLRYPEYQFNGRIGDEQIRLYENTGDRELYLEVKKTDGSKIQYKDRGSDLKIDEIKIESSDGHAITYSAGSSNSIVRELMGEGQKQFDEYLEKIHEINSAPLYK